MQIIGPDQDFVPTASFKRHRLSCACPLSPLLIIDGISCKTFSYNKLPSEPLKLTVLKLDGSSFDVEIAKTAKVAELKQAVEAVFSHMPKKGPGKISWSHVWGQFCLCYDDQMLTTDNKYIKNYGIKDGDQLQFARHVSINYNFVKKRSSDQDSDSEQPRNASCRSDCDEGTEQNAEKNDISDDQENLKLLHGEDEDEEAVRHHESNCAHLMGRWITYQKLTSPRRRHRTSCLPSARGFVSSFKTITRLCSKRFNGQRQIWKQV